MIPVADRRNGTLQGAYVARKEQGELELILWPPGAS